jgi:hypothetical protein
MRVTTVKSARKDAGTCQKCREPVAAGPSYKWFKPRYGRRVIAHASCPSFRRSELTTNDKLSSLYAIQEEIGDFKVDSETTLEDAKSFMEDQATAAGDVAEMYRESASNIEDGFGHATSASEEMEEHASEVEDWASTLRDCLDSLEEFEYPEDKPTCVTCEKDEDDDVHSLDTETYNHSFEPPELEDRESWEEAVGSAMDDASNELPL